MTHDSKTELYLGLDVGTQSTKGLILEVVDGATPRIVARSAHAYGLLDSEESGAAEQHPDTWREAVQEVISELGTEVDLQLVAGVGVSGQQHGSVFLDGDGEVIRPAKLWCDTTTAAEAEELSQQNAFPIPAGFTLPKLLWLQRHENENYERLRTLLLPHDYLNFLLTGKRFMEAGDASGTGILDPKTRGWNESLMSALGERTRGFFPDLVAPDSAFAISAAGAGLFGLPEGAIVSPGGGDNMMSAIGAGATAAGKTVLSLGTSGTVFAYSAQPIIDNTGAIAPFCDSTGAWLPLLCTMNVTGVTEAVRASYGNPSLEALTKLAEVIAPGSEGLMLLPYLQGERVPNLPDATGALLGIRPSTLTPGHVFRAAIEGTTMGLVAGVERMKELGLEVSEISVVGGGSKNPLWRQIIADAMGTPVRQVLEPESAALGGALQALWVKRRKTEPELTIDEIAAPVVEFAPTVHTPNSEAHAVYREQLARHRTLTEQLFARTAP